MELWPTRYTILYIRNPKTGIYTAIVKEIPGVIVTGYSKVSCRGKIPGVVKALFRTL